MWVQYSGLVCGVLLQTGYSRVSELIVQRRNLEFRKQKLSPLLKLSIKMLIWIPNQPLCDSQVQALLITPSCVPDVTMNRSVLIDRVLIADSPLPFNNHRLGGVE